MREPVPHAQRSPKAEAQVYMPLQPLANGLFGPPLTFLGVNWTALRASLHQVLSNDATDRDPARVLL